MPSLYLTKPQEPEGTAEKPVKQSTTGTLVLKAMPGLQGKRQNSVGSDDSSRSDQGRDVTHDSTPEASASAVAVAGSDGGGGGGDGGGEPEVKRRKAAQPHKVGRPANNALNLSAAAAAETEKRSSGGKSEMVLRGFSHAFELEVDVDATLRNVIRMVQPSVNFDLSKAAISLRGEHELTLDTRLRYFVRGGSQGVVKVKLVVVCAPNDKLRVTILDVLQAEPVPMRLPTPPARVLTPTEESAKKRIRKPKKTVSLGKIEVSGASVDESDWITSESFALLRSSLGLPHDPSEWDQSHVSHWLAWATKSFSLPELNVNLFSKLSGTSLCSLSREMFSALVGKDKDDLFWMHFHILRTTQRAAVPAGSRTPEFVPSPKVPIKRLSRSTGAKKPLTMSEGWKHRDDLFSSENAGTIQLWQFLLETLAAGREGGAIGWSGEPGEFVLIEPERVAELWGKRKNKDNMNYEKMSRALRYYYGGDILAKVPGKHYTYKFVCDLSAAGYTGPTSPRTLSPRPLMDRHSSQPSSPSLHGSNVDSDGSSVDVPVRKPSVTKSPRAGSLANALESIRRRHGGSQVAA